jgi:hypothetical protein
MLIGSMDRENANQNNPENEIVISDEHASGIILDYDLLVSNRARAESTGKCQPK